MVKGFTSKFAERITFTVPNFMDFIYEVERFCGYFKEMGKTCPCIKADQDTGRQFQFIANFDAQNCMWLCKHFIRQDLPGQARRVNKTPPKINYPKKRG